MSNFPFNRRVTPAAVCSSFQRDYMVKFPPFLCSTAARGFRCQGGGGAGRVGSKCHVGVVFSTAGRDEGKRGEMKRGGNVTGEVRRGKERMDRYGSKMKRKQTRWEQEKARKVHWKTP